MWILLEQLSRIRGDADVGKVRRGTNFKRSTINFVETCFLISSKLFVEKS